MSPKGGALRIWVTIGTKVFGCLGERETQNIAHRQWRRGKRWNLCDSVWPVGTVVFGSGEEEEAFTACGSPGPGS